MTPPQVSANRILVWMCVLIAVNQLGFGAVVPVIALYARSFGVTQSAIGLAIAIYGLARFLVALPAGQIGDRLGRGTALAAGGLVTAAGNLLCAYAPSYGAFVGARFVAGAGAALVVTSGQIVLADITTPARRSSREPRRAAAVQPPRHIAHIPAPPPHAEGGRCELLVGDPVGASVQGRKNGDPLPAVCDDDFLPPADGVEQRRRPLPEILRSSGGHFRASR